MLLTLTTTHRPATDLGHLLRKHPDRVHRSEVAAGTAHVFYPDATEHRCTAALLLKVDPLALGQHVDDRPYAASSLLAVALGRVFASARRGTSEARPELAATPVPLEVHLPAVRCSGGPAAVHRFFEPLGWDVATAAVPLDETVPAWGPSRCVDVRLVGAQRVADALNHLYVALPVLDDTKHYWVGEAEVEKLLRAGEGWLAGHPDREAITARYLAHRRPLARLAAEGLARAAGAAGAADDDATPDEDAAPTAPTDPPVDAGEAPRAPGLAAQRHAAVRDLLLAEGAARVLDLGCGSGALLAVLLAEPSFTEVVGADVSAGALDAAARRLHLDRTPDHRRDRLRLLQTGLTYLDARLRGYDAAVLVEVVEHVDPDRLPALERAVFAGAAPPLVVLTTPNAEHNALYPGLAPGQLRHRDHRFEWTRAELAAWSAGVAARHGYAVELSGVGPPDAVHGHPTQLAVFRRPSTSTSTRSAR